MPDNLTPEQRRKTMAAVKSSDTTLERVLRAAFLAKRWRFDSYVKELPGNPDFVFAKARLTVFVDGDFWHGWWFPAWRDTLPKYWQQKIERNRRRDRLNVRRLRRLGWRVLRVWGHDVERRLDTVIERVERLVSTPRVPAYGNGRGKHESKVEAKRKRTHGS